MANGLQNGGNRSVPDKIVRVFLEKKLFTFLLVIILLVWGIMTAPFNWDLGGLPRDPVPVDAIPDIGENQQIVFSEWPGRSPQDVEDQITYPLTVALLGIPSVKTVRSYSMFGFSTIYVIFKEDAEFYWSRSRVLEKLNSLPAGSLPADVQPALGPDATALGQVFWYTLEGRDEKGNPAGGWDLQELRSVQDWQVRYSLMSAEGVSEVASIGGFVKEYQVDVDPDAMLEKGVTLNDVVDAVRMSNLDVGAKTIEVNKVEYIVRGIGFIKNVEDLRQAVVKVVDNTPVRLKDIGNVVLGPATRRGLLDKEGSEVVGGVVVVRYGENPLAAIRNVKEKIDEIAPSLPSRKLADGRTSTLTIVPFYDRTGLIYETLGTLNSALYEEIMVSIIVILVLVLNIRSSLLISGLLPLAVLACFIAMRYFGVDANIVALSGIAIAIGTMVDMGIVICENILRHLDEASPDESRLEVIYRASSEVSGAVLTAVSTTVVSFLPVFTMTGAEGKLFKPLAYTKTFALIASVIVALTIIPPFAHLLWKKRRGSGSALRHPLPWLLIAIGVVSMVKLSFWVGMLALIFGVYRLSENRLPDQLKHWSWLGSNVLLALAVTIMLAGHWLPIGPEKGMFLNVLFVGLLIGGLLGLIFIFQKIYRPILVWCLSHKMLFMIIPLVVMMIGGWVWLGFNSFFGWLPQSFHRTTVYSYWNHKFPGLGREFMPSLDEGSFLLMPTTMPHASIGEAHDVLSKEDMRLSAIPEISGVVGKIGRVDSPLDPAPISMVETVINYHPQYLNDEDGHRLTFALDLDSVGLFRNPDGVPVAAPDGEFYEARGVFLRDSSGALIPEKGGAPFRLWRPAMDTNLNPGRNSWPGINSPDDIWDAIVSAVRMPGVTSAPKLQPIQARIVMLQSGMRAPMGVKVRGPNLESIEKAAIQIESALKRVPSVKPLTVNADRVVGKPYLEIRIDREKIARYGIRIDQVQKVIMTAVGGMPVTTTIEGRERYPVRVRYYRELRDNIESLSRILVPSPNGTQVPLGQLAEVVYVRGPQVIKSEDTFLVAYVTFDRQESVAEVNVVEQAQNYLKQQIDSGELKLPTGVSYSFAGSYENQVRSQKTLMVVLPLAMMIIFLILFLQFNRISTTMLVFSGILLAWAGGFILLWLYGQSWFMDFSLFGIQMRQLFQIGPINLSVAVWVGFLALFGIASDNGVIVATYLGQVFERRRPVSVEQIREATVEASLRRLRPCMMTTATTILALIPVLTSTGRGSDIMVPMAIPSVGGMVFVILSLFMVPVLYAWLEERRLKTGSEPGE